MELPEVQAGDQVLRMAGRVPYGNLKVELPKQGPAEGILNYYFDTVQRFEKFKVPAEWRAAYFQAGMREGHLFWMYAEGVRDEVLEHVVRAMAIEVEDIEIETLRGRWTALKQKADEHVVTFKCRFLREVKIQRIFGLFPVDLDLSSEFLSRLADWHKIKLVAKGQTIEDYTVAAKAWQGAKFKPEKPLDKADGAKPKARSPESNSDEKPLRFKGFCSNCGRWGHKRAECRSEEADAATKAKRRSEWEARQTEKKRNAAQSNGAVPESDHVRQGRIEDRNVNVLLDTGAHVSCEAETLDKK